jgi:hypothetical protein
MRLRAPASQRITASFQISGSCAARPHRDGTGALLWALLADEAAARRRTWTGLLGFLAIEAAVFVRSSRHRGRRDIRKLDLQI